MLSFLYMHAKGGWLIMNNTDVAVRRTLKTGLEEEEMKVVNAIAERV